MKLLLISHEYPPVGGGGANACMHLIAEYRKMGHEITLVTVWFPGEEREIREEGLHILRIPAKRKHAEHCGFPEMLDYMFRAIGVCDRLVKEAKKAGRPFDLAQVFFAIPSGPIGYYLHKKHGLPYVIRFGGGDIPGFQERFRMVYDLIGPMERLIWHKAAALVANSQGLRDFAYQFDRKKEVRVIPNGVDLEKYDIGKMKPFEDSKSFFENAPVKLLFVSRLIERKGLQHLLPMLPKVMEKTGRQLQLTIVGDGPYRSELERILSEQTVSMADGSRQSLASYVTFAGQQDKEHVPGYYRDADLFVLPSKREGMPNVVLEAMASGLPILMTPCEGSSELVREVDMGDFGSPISNGFAVPLEAFPEKLALLLSEDDLRVQMGAASRRLAETEFAWATTAQRYDALFHEVL